MDNAPDDPELEDVDELTLELELELELEVELELDRLLDEELLLELTTELTLDDVLLLLLELITLLDEELTTELLDTLLDTTELELVFCCPVLELLLPAEPPPEQPARPICTSNNVIAIRKLFGTFIATSTFHVNT